MNKCKPAQPREDGPGFLQAGCTPLLVWSCTGCFGLAVSTTLAFADFASITEPA